MAEADHEHSTEFWPEGVKESPGLHFVLSYIMLPALLIFIIFAYFKTIRFAYNTVVFYRRFMKKDERGEFEIPTKNVRRRKRGNHNHHKDGAAGGKKEKKKDSALDNFKRQD